jgi:hypothetical protein
MAQSKLRTVLTGIFFFLAGVLVGGALFAPWETVWSRALGAADASMQKLDMRWAEMDQAAYDGAALRDLRLLTPAGSYRFSGLEFRLGLLTPATVRADTEGSLLDVEMGYGKNFEFQGDMDLGSLLSGALQGLCQVAGNVSLDGDYRPENGAFNLHAPVLMLPDGTRLENVTLVGALAGNTLNVQTLSLQKPLPVEAVGSIRFNWGNLAASTFDLQGNARLGSMNQRFQKTGTLSELRGLATGGIESFFR